MQHNTAETENLPTVFNDSIALRAKQLRFRGIGNPYQFLDDIGIIPIKEYLFRGANIIDLADTLNVPITLINQWIEKNNYVDDIREASTLSAEGYIYRGERLLHQAQTKFDLDKAKAMLEHGRFMASKKDKKQYGNLNEQGAPGGAVTYIFNIGEPAPRETLQAKTVDKALDAEFNEVPSLSLDFNIGEKPPHLEKTPKSNIEPVKDRLAEQDKWEF